MNVRQPAVAGSFYPGSREGLRKEVENLLGSVDLPLISGKILGGMAPHAGYMFSGQAQAYLYKALEPLSFNTAVIIASSHYAFYQGASVYPEGAYLTPLGEVDVAEEITKKLLDYPEFNYVPSAHQREHSIEVQLPFLQVIKGNVKIVPIVVSEFDLELTKRLGKAIHEVTAGRNDVIFIASSDLSHYPPYEIAKKVDNEILKRIVSLDPEGLHESAVLLRRERGVSTAICGEGAVLTLLYCLLEKGVKEGKLLIYYNSGDVEKFMREEVVGYGAVIFLS